MTLRTVLALGFLVGFVFLAIPIQSEAAGLVPCGGTAEPPCQLCDTFVLVQNILNIFLFPFVPLIGGLLLVIGGFLFFVAGANPQQVSRARTIIWAVVIGILIIYLSWIFINTFLNFVGINPWTGLGNWWQIECPS